MMHKNNKLIKFISFTLAMVLLSGCGSTLEQSVEDEITLEEPVGISANYDVATYRDLYSYDLYSTVISPYVTEYSFEKDHTFKKYAYAPGTTVEEGSALVYSETRDIDKQVEEIDEAIADLEADHLTEVDAMQKDISDAKKTEQEAAEGVASFYTWKPDEADKAAYDRWASILVKPQIAHKRLVQARERLEQSLKEMNETYEVEHQYKLDTKNRLQSKITDATIQAKDAGVIVNCNFYYGGENIAKEIPIIAVGDPSVKVLKTDYIAQSTIAKAEDYYAIIDGKRYEVTYEPMEAEEYKRLEADGQTVRSNFYVQDPSNELTMGQYAVLVLVKESRRDVLCVPQDAVKVEKDATYCYVYDGENSIYTDIETGMKDGMYIEVLSGLTPGEKVLSANGAAMKKNKAKLETGVCQVEYEAGGYLFYPFTEWLTNPVEQGSSYVKEILVSNNQQVKEGETLMTLDVISDDIEIARIRKRLERLSVRLQKLQKEKADNDARKIIDRQVEKNITANMSETSRLNRTLSKLTKYSGTIEVKAPKDGIITDVGAWKEGDLCYANANLLQFADSSSRFIVVRDEKGSLAYGNTAEIEYVDKNGQRQTVEGTVVTVDNMSLSKDMVKDWMLISLPEESRESFDGSRQEGGRWSRDMFTSKVQTRSMDNVVLIPKAAVELVGGTTYVTVIDKDGNVARKSFMSGGSNNNYYWAISGLEEGMEICWE